MPRTSLTLLHRKRIGEALTGKPKPWIAGSRHPHFKHGDGIPSSPHNGIYHSWYGMNARCHNPIHEDYPKYGHRGIVVCEEWKTDYLTFKKWALEAGWRKGHQIHRLNHDGDYSPTNSEFLTKSEHNKRHQDGVGVPCNRR